MPAVGVTGRTMAAPLSYDIGANGRPPIGSPGHSVGATGTPKPTSTGAAAAVPATPSMTQGPSTVIPGTSTQTSSTSTSASRGPAARGGQAAPQAIPGGPGESLGYLAQFFEQLRAQYPMAGSGGLINEGLMPWRQDMGGIRAPSA